MAMCSAPYKGHIKGSKQQRECPVHGGALASVPAASATLPPSSRRAEVEHEKPATPVREGGEVHNPFLAEMTRRRADLDYVSPDFSGRRSRRGRKPMDAVVNVGIDFDVSANLPLKASVSPSAVGFDSCFITGEIGKSIGGGTSLDHCVVDGKAHMVTYGSVVTNSVIHGVLRLGAMGRATDVIVNAKAILGGGGGGNAGALIAERVSISGHAQVMGQVTVTDSYAAGGWFLAPGSDYAHYDVTLSRPGQVVVIDQEDRETACLSVPQDGTVAVMTHEEAARVFRFTTYDPDEDAAARVEIFSGLIGRPRDGSRGPWLHASNTEAYRTLCEREAFDEDGKVSDLDVELALAVHANI